MKDHHQNVFSLTERALLTTKNVRLKDLNNLIVSRISGFEREFRRADSVKAKLSKLNYPVELFSFVPSTACLPDPMLLLKNGYMVMLLQNLKPKHRHVPRGQYIVEKMTKNVLFLKAAAEAHKWKCLILQCISCNPGNDYFSDP